jgi:hypothetical protein
MERNHRLGRRLENWLLGRRLLQKKLQADSQKRHQ